MRTTAAGAYQIFTEKGEGSAQVSGDILKVSGPKSLQVRLSHVLSFEKTNTLPLNKVEAELKYFDLFGNTESYSFAMREANFRALKSEIGK